jgi:ABC-type uncharacterized transport system ATPase subunit
MSPPILRCVEVTKQFAERRAVDRLDFAVEPGEIFALLGPNGAGKTTLVRMLVGLLRPDSGRIEVHVEGTVAARLPAATSGYLPEERGLYREISVLRSLIYFGRLRGLTTADAERSALDWLSRLGLADRARERLDALSKGNQQRVQFAAAVLHRPRFVVLDEPFSGLDPLSQDFFLDLVRELRAAGTTILLSAHQMDLVERVADRILVMNHRRQRLAEAGWTEQALDRVLAAPELEVHFLDPRRGRVGRAEKVVAGAAVGLVLVTLFTSLAYLLTGITGEKQLRVTESVLAAIRPQAWIDGKILGITAYSLSGAVNFLLGSLALTLAGTWASGHVVALAVIRPSFLVVLAVTSGLGLLLWNCFLAAVAATVDDPNTSSRSGWLFLPILPMTLSLAVFKDPDAWFSRFLAVLPVTSLPALPVRFVLSDPGIWEITVAWGLLVLAVALTRRLAGKIFEIGMLLYGKEPTLTEILRWARSPKSPDG